MLLEKVRKAITENSLLKKGDTVICAVSGGADSVCLFHTMMSLKDEYELKIVVANVNHMIRGDEANRDSDFVKKLCEKHSIDFFYREYDVPAVAKERKIGEEECGRLLRYEYFKELSHQLNGAKIATAHNLNDNAETVIFRMIRGSGSRGISGIKYKRDNVIRPLLDVSRTEIEAYLKDSGISWCEDSTNQIPLYTRNKIRLSVIPLLEEIVHGAQEKIVLSSKLVSLDSKLLDEMAQNILNKCFFEGFLLTHPVTEAPLAVATRVAATVLENWGAEVSYDRICSFLSFMEKESGKRFDINKEKFAEKNYDRIYLRKINSAKNFSELLDFENPVSDKNWKLEIETADMPLKKKNNCFAAFDADKIKPPFTVRYRKEGDRIKIKGIGGTKKLSDLFTDTKTERYLRDSIPVVEKNGEILYVGGLRQSSLFEIDDSTKKGLIIKYTAEER